MKQRLLNNCNTWRQDIGDSVLIASVLTALSYAIGLAFRWETSINWLEVFAVWTSYSCTYLCVKERRFNYPIGAASTAAYAVLFLHSHLYSSALLNIYLTPTLIYGWIRWRKDTDTRPVTFVSGKWWPVYLIVSGAGFVGASLITHGFGGAYAWMDASILAGTILAQFLMDNKKLENWIIWLIVDIIATYEYFAIHLYLVGFQYIFFLLNTLYGFIVWRRSMNNESIRVDDGVAANIGSLATGSVC